MRCVRSIYGSDIDVHGKLPRTIHLNEQFTITHSDIKRLIEVAKASVRFKYNTNLRESFIYLTAERMNISEEDLPLLFKHISNYQKETSYDIFT